MLQQQTGVISIGGAFSRSVYVFWHGRSLQLYTSSHYWTHVPTVHGEIHLHLQNCTRYTQCAVAYCMLVFLLYV